MVTAVLISGQHFSSTVTREVKCTTVNGVHVCFCGWCRCRAKGVCERNILIKEIRKPIKKKKKRKVHWLICLPNYSCDVNSLHNICIFLLYSMLCCSPCNLRAAVCTDVTGGRWKKGGRWKENRFHSSLAWGFWEQQEQLITARTEGGSY